MYFQLLFTVDRVKAFAPQHPEWKEAEPFASFRRTCGASGGWRGTAWLAPFRYVG